ncbi:hypothetical protein Rhopal_007222-T1 [Rhodotorula paludigena]|uniref:S-adenosyl-L-methionine-dependent methyltransferase n=1 Tax=Rhodotorula paludigena TaxID=86838 RepID=A0AAV5H077_9BASI|nr:hypothetical protein Rhopal_007222-T1 [Rhodotorula paludigena]
MLAYAACVLAGLLLPTLAPALLRAVSAFPREIYGDDDADALLLNIDEPRSRWFNMGYWTARPRTTFPEAAAELCRRVALAAGLSSGQRVCEVGYGSGESTLLLEREFAPASYLGYTSLAREQRAAVLRANREGIDQDRFELRQGDAVQELAQLPPGSFDAVLAVDCAYHFNTRTSFLSSAHRILAPSGSLALTDLLLPHSLPWHDLVLLRLLFYLAGCPFSNFVSPATYRAQLVAAGFDASSIELHDISADVWPGFCAFVQGRDKSMGAVLGKGWRALVWYAKVVEWYSGAGGGTQKLGFYLISARKKADKAE